MLFSFIVVMSFFLWLLRALDAVLVVLMGLRITYGFSGTTYHHRTTLACAVFFSCKSTDRATTFMFLHFAFSLSPVWFDDYSIQLAIHSVDTRYQ